MTNAERYEKYIEEHCTNCKNKDTDLCEIRIINRIEDVIVTKCEYYERKEKYANKSEENRQTTR